MSVRDAIRGIFGMLFYPVILFGCAGTIAWVEGWIFVTLMMGFAVIVWVQLARNDPELLKERMRSPWQKEQKNWDKVFMAVFLLAFLAWLPLAAFDSVRYGWTRVPLALEILGGIGYVASSVVIARTFRENTYLAAVVKVQRDRGHRVISTGPYAVVRHPMYAALLVYVPSASLLLGSWYATAASVVIDALLVVRTVLEDRTLHDELEGYADYARRVRFRLVPGVW